MAPGGNGIEIARPRALPGGTALGVSIYRKRERGFYLRYILIPRETLGVPMRREAKHRPMRQIGNDHLIRSGYGAKSQPTVSF